MSRRHVIWLLLALILTPVLAHAAPPPLPDRNPARVGTAEAEKPVIPGDKPTLPWLDTKVAKARAECSEMLADVTLDYESLPPIKQGVCGAPAPILVKSVGSDPAVVIAPPAIVTCKLAVTLHGWLKDKVQPEARARLGSPVVKLRNAASYDCRNRYGGTNTRLSEHALANALDISAFVLASGERVTVLDSWHHIAGAPPLIPPKPEPNPVRMTAAAAFPEAATETTGTIIAVSTPRSIGSTIVEITKIKSNPFVRPMPPPVAQPPRSELPQAASGQDAIPHATVVPKAKSNPFVSLLPSPEADEPPEPGIEAERETAPPPPASIALGADGAFVRAIHKDACELFGTVLGPAANEAHKDHFHLDMKKRRYVTICD